LMLLSFMFGSWWSSLRRLPFSVSYFLPCGNKTQEKRKKNYDNQDETDIKLKKV
jgi:hypothetical protein